MGKKKKKKKKKVSILAEVDKNLDQTHKKLLEEIEDLQLRVSYADQRARQQAKRMAKKKNGKFYDYEELRRKARMEVVGNMESNNFLERIMKALNEIAPIVIIIGRLIASLILAILSIDKVKLAIKPETLEKMTSVYNRAMAIT